MAIQAIQSYSGSYIWGSVEKLERRQDIK